MHVCFTCTRPATQPLLPQGLKTSLPFPCLIEHTCLKPRLQPSSYICNSFTRLSGLLQYHVFKLCSETAGMFVTDAPGYLAHRIQACISVRFANTFVVVGLCQQVCLLHLPQTRSYVFYACTRQMGCLAQLHQTIRHVCYSST